MLLCAIEEQREKCGECIGQATVYNDGRQTGQIYCSGTVFVQPQCVVGLRNVATPQHCSVRFLKTGQHFTALWLLYVPPGLIFNNSKFCPHSVFMCFVWISEQTAIISVYDIN